VKPGFYTKYPDGKEDDTHFNEYGARIVAELVVEEIKKMNTHLSDFLIEK
jgi:lysophospholipase L1-like esterase